MALTPEEFEQYKAEMFSEQPDDYVYQDPYGTEEESDQNSGIVGDLVTSAQEGFYQTGADLTGALNLSSAEGWLMDKVEEQNREYSPEMMAAKADFGVGEGKTLWNRALFSEIAKQGGQLPMYMVPGGVAAKGISVAAKGLGAVKKARIAVQAAKKSGDKFKIGKAADKLKKAEGKLTAASSAAGYGTVSGLVIAEGTADEVQDYLTNRSPEDWMNDEAFVELYEDNLSKDMKDTVAWDTAIQDTIDGGRAEAFWKAGAMGAATGSLGGPLLQKAVTGGIKGGIGKSAAAGVLAEAPTEFVEEGGQALIAGDVADVEVDAMERATLGAALGGIIGGGAGAAGGKARGILGKNNEELDAIAPNVADMYSDFSSVDLAPSKMTPITEEATSPADRQRILTERRDELGSAQDIESHEIETTPLQQEMDDALIGNAAAAREELGKSEVSAEAKQNQRNIDNVWNVIADANKTNTFSGGYDVLSAPKLSKRKKKAAPPIGLGGGKEMPDRPAGQGIGASNVEGYGDIKTKTKGSVVKEEKKVEVEKVEPKVEEKKVEPAKVETVEPKPELTHAERKAAAAKEHMDKEGLQVLDTVKFGNKKADIQSINEEKGTAVVQKFKERKGEFVPAGDPTTVNITALTKDTESDTVGSSSKKKVAPLVSEEDLATIADVNTAMGKISQEVKDEVVEGETKKVLDPALMEDTGLIEDKLQISDRYVWEGDGFYDKDGNETTPPRKKAIEFFGQHPEAIESSEMSSWLESKGYPTDTVARNKARTSKERKRLDKAISKKNRMESTYYSEDNDITPDERAAILAEYDAATIALREVEDTAARKAEDEAAAMAEGEKASVEQVEETLEGIDEAAAGQGEVDIDTVLDVPDVADMPVAPTTTLTAEDKAEREAEKSKKEKEAEAVVSAFKKAKESVEDEDTAADLAAKTEVIPPTIPQNRKETREARKEAKAKSFWTADELDDALDGGVITHARAKQITSPVGVEAGLITSAEADMWIEGDSILDEDLTSDWYNQKVNGIINEYGVNSPEHLWAKDNIEKYPDFDDRADAEGFHNTVQKLVAQDTTATAKPDELAMPDWAAPTKPNNTKASIEQEFKDRFNNKLPRNVEVYDTYDDIPSDRKNASVANAGAFYSPTTKKVYMIADKIRKGKALNTLFHEKSHQLLQSSPEWNDVLINVKLLLARKDPQVTQAYNQAVKAVDADRLSRDPDAIDKETVAYLLTFAPEASISKRIIRKLKELMRKLTGYEMSTQDVIDMVVMKAEADVESNSEQMVREFNEGNMEAIQAGYDEDINITDELEQSVDPELQTQLMGDPSQSHYKALDNIGKMTSDTAGKIKKFGLGFIPTRPLLEMMDRILPDGVSVSGIQDHFGIAESASNQRIEKLNDGLNKEMFEYQRDDIQDYRQMVRVALSATRSNKDAEGTPGYNKLSPVGQDMYKRLRDHYKQMATDKVEALIANVEAMELDSAKKKDMMNIIDQLQRELSGERVYFPFDRFGSFSVRGKTDTGMEYVAHYDTKWEAQKGLEAAQRKGYTELSTTIVRNDQKTAEGALTPEAYQMASRFIETMKGGKEAQEAMWRTFVHYSPHSASMKKMLVRRNIAGMSEDMVRGLNRSINKDIRANELMKVKPHIDKIMSDVTKSVEEMQSVDHVDNTQQIEMLNEIKSRAEAKDVRAEWSKKATKLNFAYYLGFNPASAMINMTQNVIMGVPVLLGDHGVRSFTKMNREFAHVAKNIGNKATMGYTGTELDAYKQMKDEQIIDVTNAHMMVDLNEGASVEANPFGLASKFVRGSAWMFHNAEIMNRATMAMTAFKLNYEKTGDYQGSIAYAKKKTYDAHFDFSETGKSRMQQTDIGNVALALKSYPIGMATAMIRNFNRALFDQKATPEEKREARYQLMGTFTATAVLGGAGALPLMGLLPEVFFALFGDDDDETPEHAFRKGVESIMGEDLADVFIDGLVGKVTGLDIQSKVSIGLDMFARVQGGQSATDMKDRVVEGALGPVYAMASNMTRGIDQMNEGKIFTGITTMLPTALRNAMKSVDNLDRGTAQTSYDTFVEDFDEKDAIWKFMGFNSSEYAEHYQEAAHERRLEQSITKKKRYLLREYSMAFLQGDGDERREARKGVREYNRNAGRDDRISQSTLKRSITNYREKITGDKK